IVEVTKKIRVNYYVKQGKMLLERQDTEQAIAVFNKGLGVYPNNYKLHTELAYYEMGRKKWELAIYHWNIVFNTKKRNLTPEFYIAYSKSLQFDKQFEGSMHILSKGFLHFSNNKEIIVELASTMTKLRKWADSIRLWNKYFEIEDEKPIIKAYTNLAHAYRRLGAYEESESVLKRGLKFRPDNKKIRNQYAVIAIHMKKWIV